MVSSMTAPSAFVSRAFFAAITLYFVLQVILRLALGGALETDEAEMMVMTPGLRLGYGPQLPLYNWVQVILFDLFGKSLFALSFLKNCLLLGTYALVFIGFRLWVPTSAAALGALSLYLLPDVAWEAQRATTHSNMLLITSAATLAAFLWVLKSGRRVAYITLGIAIGLGALAKYNFWLVPIGLILAALTMAQFRARVAMPQILATIGVAAAICALPYKWMFDNPALAFSSTAKLAISETPDRIEILQGGVGDLLSGYAVLMVLPVLVCAALCLVFQKPAQRENTTDAIVALLFRAALIMAALVAAGVIGAGVSHVTPRWLLPVVFFAAPAMFLHFLGTRGGSLRGLAVILAILATTVSIGLGVDRYKDRARRAVDFTPLVTALATVQPSEQTPIIAEFFTAGNLSRLQPDWRIAPYLGFAAQQFGGEVVLFVLREKVPRNLKAGLREAGWPAGAELEILERGKLNIPFDTSGETLPVRWVLARTAAAAP